MYETSARHDLERLSIDITTERHRFAAESVTTLVF
jgi:hypothetical protein